MIYEFKLTYDVTVETLTINPAGWDATGISFVRNEFYNSVLRSLSVKLRFARKTGGGGTLLKTAYDTDGLSAIVTVEIKKLNPQTADYDAYYDGIINFNDIDIQRDYIEGNIIDGSKEQKFISRDEINYNLDDEVSTDDIAIDAFVSSPLEVNLPPIDIYLEALSTGDSIDSDGPAASISGTDYYDGVLTINTIGSRVLIQDPGIAKIYENTSGESVSTAVNYDVDHDVEVLYYFLAGAGSQVAFTASLKILHKNSGGALQNTHTIFSLAQTDTSITADGEMSFTGNDTGTDTNTLADGDYLELIYQYTATPDDTNITVESSWNLDYTQLDMLEISASPEAESPAKMYLPHEVFTRLVQLMTSETTTSKLFYSPELGRTDSEFTTYGGDGDYSLFALTNGKAIRQFPDTPINISMRDAFSMMLGIAPLGLGYDRINERFYVDTIDQFYKNSSMFDLGDVKELSIKPYKLGYHSQILGGYSDKVEYEEIQGANEFNVSSEYANIIPVKEKLDVGSPVHGDSVGIELARRMQYDTDGTSDTRYDDKNYVVSTERASGFTALVGSDYTSVTGFTGVDEYYNIDITPKRNLLRWGSVLTAALWKQLTSTIKFVKTQTNINITSQLAAETPVVETDDVDVADLDNPLYYPEAYEFIAPVNEVRIAALNSDPHRYIDFSFDGEDYKGYLLSVEMSDYSEEAKWTLLRANTTR